MTEFSVLLGKALTTIENTGDEIVFTTTDGKRFRQYHSQDCCESVSVEEVVGDFADLIGSPILQAEEAQSSDAEGRAFPDGYEPKSFTWTFYKLATIKGSVTIRWFGSSNGYYSESVDFVEDDGEERRW